VRASENELVEFYKIAVADTIPAVVGGGGVVVVALVVAKIPKQINNHCHPILSSLRPSSYSIVIIIRRHVPYRTGRLT